MNMLTRKELLERGWTKAKAHQFARKSHIQNENNEEVWDIEYVERIEKSLSFQKFTTEEEFNKRKEEVEKILKETTQSGIAHVQSLSLEFEKHDCLLKNKENYDPFKPVFHLVKKDFVPDDNGSYSLFTDGCFKSIGNQSFACCAGWILDNKKNEVVIEFSKTLELNPENIKGKGMPKFELMGIIEGVKAIAQLGLKNVQCYTDSISEAKTILSATKGISDKSFNNFTELYEPMVEILNKTNSSIGWLPREYNSHADELTKFPLNAWLENHNKTHVSQDHIAEKGYVIDREKQVYFHQTKAKYIPYEESPIRFTIASVYYATEVGNNKIRKIVSLIHDKEGDSVTLLGANERDFSYIDDSLPNDIKQIKKVKPDGIILVNLSETIKKVQDIEELNIYVPAGVAAVVQKFSPILPGLQEEFFEFHKACVEFPGKINIVNLNDELRKRFNKFLEYELPELIDIDVSNKNKKKM